MKAYNWNMVVLTYCSYYHRGLNNEKKTNFGLNRIFAKKRNLSTFKEKQTEKCSSIFNIFSINPLSSRTLNIKKIHHYVCVIQHLSINPITSFLRYVDVSNMWFVYVTWHGQYECKSCTLEFFQNCSKSWLLKKFEQSVQNSNMVCTKPSQDDSIYIANNLATNRK